MAETFRQAKEAGYEGVELSLGAQGEICMDSTREEIEHVKALTDAAGIRLYCVAANLHWECCLNSDDPESREMAKSVIRKQLDVAFWLGL